MVKYWHKEKNVKNAKKHNISFPPDNRSIKCNDHALTQRSMLDKNCSAIFADLTSYLGTYLQLGKGGIMHSNRMRKPRG